MLIRNLLWSFRGMKIVTWSLSRNGRSEAVELFSGFSKIEDPENLKWKPIVKLPSTLRSSDSPV